MHSTLSHSAGIGLILLGALVISPMGAIVAMFDHAGPMELLVYRCLGVFLFFICLLKASGTKSLLAEIKNARVPGMLAGLSLALALVLSMYSFQHTTVARTLLLFAIAPVFTAVLGWLVIGERLSWVTLCAIALSIFGIYIVVVGGNDFSSNATTRQLSGDIAALFGSIMFAVFSVSLRAGRTLDMRPAMFLAGGFGIVFGLVLSGITNQEFSADFSEALLMVIAGFFLTGAAFLLFSIGSKSVSAAEFTMVSLSEVFWGSLWAWLIVSQSVSKETAIGAIIFFTAVFIDSKFAR